MVATNTLLQNRYLVLRQLGEGGQAAVYEARDQRLDIRVALKQTFYGDERSRQAFEREAQLLARLRHDALPNVIDHFFEADGQFLVMEYVPGEDLGALINRHGRAFPAKDALDWGDQLLAALEYLHQLSPPIIHRDIKPQNLKLSERGRVMLLDFGLAKASNTTVIRGYSRHYSSLEQMRGRRADVRDDLYGVGATLYHLLTGKLPPDAESRDEAIEEDKPDPLLPACVINPRVTQAVSDALAQAMSLSRDHRPPNAFAMRVALQQARKQTLPFDPSAKTNVDHSAADTETAAPTTAKASPLTAVQSDVRTDVDASARTELGADAPTTQDSMVELQVARDPTVAGESRAKRDPTVAEEIERDPAVGKQIERDPTVEEQLEEQLEPPPAPAPRKQFMALAGAAAILAVLAIAGLAYWLWPRESGRDNQAAIPASKANAGEPAAPARVEAVSYRLELNPEDNPSFVSGAGGLTPDDWFRFHFVPATRGYLYILGPDNEGRLSTFLTSQPYPRAGIRTNLIEAGADFVFPAKAALGIAEDLNASAYTIIFSPQPLTSPAFLQGKAARTLIAEELRQLADFRQQYNSLTTRLEAKPDGDRVVVAAPADRIADHPLIFDINIQQREAAKPNVKQGDKQ